MAVIRVTPADDITTVINNTANPGDIILAEDGVYNQTVVVTKDNIRVIAKGGKSQRHVVNPPNRANRIRHNKIGGIPHESRLSY